MTREAEKIRRIRSSLRSFKWHIGAIIVLMAVAQVGCLFMWNKWLSQTLQQSSHDEASEIMSRSMSLRIASEQIARDIKLEGRE